MPSRSRLPLLALASLALISCASSRDEAPKSRARSSQAPIIHGVVSDASQDEVVLIIHTIDATNSDSCSGSLIAPNLVLTARHCVSDTSGAGFSCGADGVGSPEGAVLADYDPASLGIFVGVAAPGPTTRAAGTGKKIIHDTATNLCNHDLALILLAAPIAGAKVGSLRLDAKPKFREAFAAVGWGVTDLTNDPPSRMQRKHVLINAVGVDVTNDVPSNEFAVGESICSGDSGGPALAETTNAILGVVSRGGRDTPPVDASAPGADCIGATNDYTQVAGFKDLILGAFKQAGYAPVLEGDAPDAGPVDAGAVDDGGGAGDSATDDTGASSDADTGVASAPGGGATPASGTTSSNGSCNLSARDPSSSSASSGMGAGSLGLATLGLFVARRRRR